MARHDARRSGAASRNTGPEPPLERHWTASIGKEHVETPVVSHGRVFARTDSSLAAVDVETGEQLWRYEADTEFSGDLAADVSAGSSSADDSAGDFVYVQAEGSDADRSGRILALDGTTGEPRWTHELESDAGDRLLVAAGTVYVVTDDRLLALDAATGELAWWYYPGYPYRVVDSAALGTDTVYLTAHTDNVERHDRTRPVTGAVIALDPASESVRWSAELHQPYTVSTAGEQLLVFDVEDGFILAAFDESTGERLWQTRPAGWAFAVRAGTVYCQVAPGDSEEGPVVAGLDLDGGDERERYDLGYPDARNEYVYPTITGGRLYAVTSADRTPVDVLDLRTGSHVPVPADHQRPHLTGTAPLAVADDLLFRGVSDGRVVALR